MSKGPEQSVEMRQVLREHWALSKSAELPAGEAFWVPFASQNDVLHSPEDEASPNLSETAEGGVQGWAWERPPLLAARAAVPPSELHTDLTASAAHPPSLLGWELKWQQK